MKIRNPNVLIVYDFLNETWISNFHIWIRPEERIKIIFEEVSFQKGDDSCINRQDFIKVYDGISSSSANVLTLCNEVTDVDVYSTGSQMYVEFDAKDPWPGQGFKASYYFQNINDLADFKEIQQAEFRRNLNGVAAVGTNDLQRPGPQSNRVIFGRPQPYPAIRGSCDILFSSRDKASGTFSSPLYPASYPGNSRCLYVFQGHGRERVQIVFNDFHLFYSNKHPTICRGSDAIFVYSKVEGRMEKINTLCGSDVPVPVMSSGPILALEFVGYYSSINIRGFSASYHFLQNYGVKSGLQLSGLPCAFQYNSSSMMMTHAEKTFASPNFPGNYPRNLECHYFFHTIPDEKVQINFTYFNVEGVSPCDEHSESDFVELSNYMAHDRLYVRYCGNVTGLIVTSIRNFFRITFKSNGVLDGIGFQATYKFVIEKPATENTDITVPITNFAPAENYENVGLHISVLLLLHIVPFVWTFPLSISKD